MSDTPARGGHVFRGASVRENGRAHFGDVFNGASELRPSFFETSDYEVGRHFNVTRVPGTLEWFLHHRSYTAWRDGGNGRVLLVTAEPGCGKSVLSRAIIDQDSHVHADGSADVLYFFFRDQESQKHATTAVCALLHQLFLADEELFRRHAESAIQAHNKEGTSNLTCEFENLWRIFVNAVQDSKKKVKCVIDGLDECHRPDTMMLLEHLENFWSSEAGRSSELSILITSRPYQHLEERFRMLTLAVRGACIYVDNYDQQKRADIETVLDSKLKQLAVQRGLEPEVQTYLAERLREKQLGGHAKQLWLGTIWPELEKVVGDSAEDFEDVLQTLPVTVEAVYEKILSRIPPSKAREASIVLQIMLVASYRLNVNGNECCAQYTIRFLRVRRSREKEKVLCLLQGDMWASCERRRREDRSSTSDGKGVPL